MAFTLTALRQNFDNQCRKIDAIWKQLENLNPDSDEYKSLKQEITKIETNKLRTANQLKDSGNDDPAYFM